MVTAKWFNFNGGPVTETLGGVAQIPAGTHYVVFDGFVTATGAETCEIRWLNKASRVERAVLIALCADGQARFVRDA